MAFKKLDVDGNGSIERSEIIKLAGLGKNTSNSDSSNRRANGRKADGGMNSMQELINEFFNAFDENNDGMIQKEEWLSFFAHMFDNVVARGL